MKHVIIGTAGHVDHGKTLLVKALTGIDTDRLQEEKKRGITIELGFAHLDWEDGTQAGIVDVPGHEKFIKNMLAGAGGIDLAMLVVAADEGFMPQTVEHLGILTLLGIREGRHYPNPRFWQIAGEEGVSVVIGIDAHDPAHILRPDVEAKAMELVRDNGLDLLETVPLAGI